MTQTLQLPGDAGNFLPGGERGAKKLLSLAMLAGGGVLLYTILPSLIAFTGLLTTFLGALLGLLAMGGLLALSVYILMHPRLRTLVSASRDWLANKVTYFFISYDPIGHLESYVNDHLQRKQEKVRQKNILVSSKRTRLRTEREKAGEEYAEVNAKLKVFKTRQEQGKLDDKQKVDYNIYLQRAGLLHKRIQKRDAQIKRIELYLDILQKIERGLDLRIATIRANVEDLRSEYEATRDMAEAASAAEEGLGGDDRGRLQAQTIKYVEEQIAGYVGYTDSFLERSREFIADADLEGEVQEQRLRAEMEAFDTQFEGKEAPAPTPVESVYPSLISNKLKGS